MLQDRNDSLAGKRCMIIGSGKLARSLAKKLLEYGAIPLTFSDMSGHVYEPEGFDAAKLRTISKIKNERGAKLGRYIIASTTAQFNDPPSVLDIPCDLCFPCGAMNDVNELAAQKLADAGCMGIIEGGHSCVTAEARSVLKKRGLVYGPHTLTMSGSCVVQSLGAGTSTATTATAATTGGLSQTDQQLKSEIARIYKDVKTTATEFNARGDLFAGATILGFLKVANVMMTHGAV
mmetsp:Transcript_4507/g.6852  ORF Transcript_4507/g.6852 Transcript_4507/m.6852 type:complete len:234 (+) Transcript_4507:68-769(+)